MIKMTDTHAIARPDGAESVWPRPLAQPCYRGRYLRPGRYRPADRIARLGGEPNKAPFLDRPGGAEEPRGTSPSQGPAGAPHTHAGMPHRDPDGQILGQFRAPRLARADNFGRH